MTKTYCDRCLKETNSTASFDIWHGNQSWEGNITNILCPDCLKSLQEWMKGENKLTELK